MADGDENRLYHRGYYVGGRRTRCPSISSVKMDREDFHPTLSGMQQVAAVNFVAQPRFAHTIRWDTYRLSASTLSVLPNRQATTFESQYPGDGIHLGRVARACHATRVSGRTGDLLSWAGGMRAPILKSRATCL
ncbi:hypothetical protein EVAR_25416_1 [Eumeta japonica]|uniref:Uncharacterized protein n=1 Tax=Eumeta variegata TaxID=151549 RepID=A0A4C1V7U7_EUMVA|nr:hypothetical protein EVAR_25416_1 [Eumeta japonica]